MRSLHLLFISVFSAVLVSMTKQDSTSIGTRQDSSKIVKSKVEEKTNAIISKINKAERDNDRRSVKMDSLMVEKDKNISNLELEKARLTTANQRLERSNRKFAAMLSKFNSDSVKKYEEEYVDPEDRQPKEDAVKKKIEQREVTEPVRKRNIFDRIFKRNRQ